MGYMLGLRPNLETTSAIDSSKKSPPSMPCFEKCGLTTAWEFPDFPAGDVKKQRVKRLKTGKRSCVSPHGEVKPLKHVRFETTPEVWQFCEQRIKRQPSSNKVLCTAYSGVQKVNTHQRQSIDDDVETVEAKFNNSHYNTFLKPISYRSVEFWGRNKHSFNSIRSISWSLHDICPNWVPPSPFSRDLQHIQQIHGTTLPNSQPSPVFFAPRIQVWSKSPGLSAFFFRKSRTSSWSICKGRFVMGFMFWDGQAVGNHKEIPNKKNWWLP